MLGQRVAQALIRDGTKHAARGESARRAPNEMKHCAFGTSKEQRKPRQIIAKLILVLDAEAHTGSNSASECWLGDLGAGPTLLVNAAISLTACNLRQPPAYARTWQYSGTRPAS